MFEINFIDKNFSPFQRIPYAVTKFTFCVNKALQVIRQKSCRNYISLQWELIEVLIT